MRRKASAEPVGFEAAIIRFSRMLSRLKRLIRELITTYGDFVTLEFNLNEGTIALGFRRTSRTFTLKPMKVRPTLLRELLEGMPKPSEIDRMVNRRIRLMMEEERQKERRLLSPADASRMLGIPPKTLWRWWKEGRIRAIRLPSGRLRYYRDDVEQLLR